MRECAADPGLTPVEIGEKRGQKEQNLENDEDVFDEAQRDLSRFDASLFADDKEMDLFSFAVHSKMIPELREL